MKKIIFYCLVSSLLFTGCEKSGTFVVSFGENIKTFAAPVGEKVKALIPKEQAQKLEEEWKKKPEIILSAEVIYGDQKYNVLYSKGFVMEAIITNEELLKQMREQNLISN